MARTTRIATGIVNDQAEVIRAALDNGYLRIYDGTQPEDADTAITDQTMLVECRFNSPAGADPASDGVIDIDPLPAASAVAAGTAAWFRTFAADGTTVIMDGSVGESVDDPNLVLDETELAIGSTVIVAAFAHAVRKSQTGL